MLFSFEELHKLLESRKIKIKGCLHIGAHLCEEISIYNSIGLANEDIIWIEANEELIENAKNKNIINIYNALITNIDYNLVVLIKQMIHLRQVYYLC
jgi:hypothetical protein